LAAPQPYRRGVDRLLSKRPESLALERRIAVTNLPAAEEHLQPVVGGAREDHAAQDLAPLGCGERRANRRAAQKAVAGRDEFLDGSRESLLAGYPRRGLLHIVWNLPAKPRPEFGSQPLADGLDRGLVGGRGSFGRGERLASHGHRERETLGHERREPFRETGHGGGGDVGHAERVATEETPGQATDETQEKH